VSLDDSYDSLSPLVDAMRQLGPEVRARISFYNRR